MTDQQLLIIMDQKLDRVISSIEEIRQDFKRDLKAMEKRFVTREEYIPFRDRVLRFLKGENHEG